MQWNKMNWHTTGCVALIYGQESIINQKSLISTTGGFFAILTVNRCCALDCAFFASVFCVMLNLTSPARNLLDLSTSLRVPASVQRLRAHCRANTLRSPNSKVE